ncbi:MAG: DUF4859 domain-containing protein [Prevotella sp.]|nr:DUF4859 domain-containing protein [Prevotella sp.]
MITTHLRNLLTAVICIFAGATAQAQFTGGVEQYPTSDYSQKAVKFSLTEVATQVGTDAATLAEAYNAWLGEEEPAENLFFLVAADGTLSSEYSANGNGFYITSEGAWGQWARDDAALAGTWFANATADAESDVFSILVGQYPDTLKAGDKVSAKFALAYGGKQATFEVSLSVIAKPEIPAPTTLVEKDLNIVGEKEIVVEQFPRSGYDSDAVQLEIGDAVAKLGFESAELLADVLGDVLYCTQYNTGDIEEGGGLKMDELSNQTTAGAPGFWLHAVQDENGIETGECSSAVFGADNKKFFVEAFAFNAETGVISCNLGQDPGTLKSNEQWYVNVYIIRGDKAYRLKYTLKINEREQGSGVEGMTKVGEDVINTEISPDTNYSRVDIYPDVDAIAAALGCEVGNFSMQALDDTDNWGGTTANNGGFWFSQAGTVISHGANSYFFIEPAIANDYSHLFVGQYPSRLSIGEEYSTKLYFVNGDNYFELTVNLSVVEEKVIDGSFKEVARRAITLQQEPNNNYTWTPEGVDIPTDYIIEKLGTSNWVVYSLNTLDENGNVREGNAKYSKNYTMAESPGFWYNSQGLNYGWNDPDAKFGISVGGQQKGKFTMIQYPNRCSIGESLKTQVFFVNEEAAEMVTFNVTYNIVSEIINYEEVGNEDLTIPVSMVEDCVIDFDFAPAAEALGVSVEELTAESSRYLKGMMAGVYSEGFNIQTGLAFDANGECNPQGDYFFYFENGKMYTGTSTDIPEDFLLPVQFAFNIDDKIYVYYANFVSEAVYTGIKTVGNEAKADNRIFDISGRQVTKPTRGLYIQNGKKVVIK